MLLWLVASVMIIVALIIYAAILYLNITAQAPVCPTGYCSTNYSNGQKTNCTDPVIYDPYLQFCSLPTSCTDPVYFYAEQTDGSTRADGQCLGNYNCNCRDTLVCADYIVSGFAQNQQVTLDTKNLSSCVISLTKLYDMQPGCAYSTSLSECLNSNPCLYGQLAFIGSANSNNYINLPLACISANRLQTCTANQASIYDPALGSIVCIDL